MRDYLRIYVDNLAFDRENTVGKIEGRRQGYEMALTETLPYVNEILSY